MPDNKDCKSTRGSFRYGNDTESAKSLCDICPEKGLRCLLTEKKTKKTKTCHLEYWIHSLDYKNTTCLL